MNAQAEFHAPTLPRKLSEIVEEYEEKRLAAETAEVEFKNAITAAEMAANIGGAFGGSIWGRGGTPWLNARDIHRVLLKSAWKHVYAGLNIDQVAPASDRNKFELAFENPPEFTLANIRATFGHYLQDPRFHILRGLAEVFCDLDPAYKSHSKIKIGVEGLPKRIILSSCTDSYGSYGGDRLKDVINALRTYRGGPHIKYREFAGMMDEAGRHGEADWCGGTLKRYMNGNGHLIFDKDTLKEINLALAEFYGEVLPDVEVEDEERDLFRHASREVAKDLQYYPTPEKVVREVIGHIHARKEDGPISILEPSCGCGRLMDGMAAWASDPQDGWRRPAVDLTGIEYNPARAAEARAKGHAVLTANFLECQPDPRFDWVVMNPPFYSLHWKKHLAHAMKFLKRPDPETRYGGGVVICILPATACYDGHLEDLGVPRDAGNFYRMRDKGWHDLPVASFAESGTNIPTGFLIKGVK